MPVFYEEAVLGQAVFPRPPIENKHGTIANSFGMLILTIPCFLLHSQQDTTISKRIRSPRGQNKFLNAELFLNIAQRGNHVFR
jgi:hypothetical protein